MLADQPPLEGEGLLVRRLGVVNVVGGGVEVAQVVMAGGQVAPDVGVPGAIVVQPLP